jgi:hypothetical protein
VLYWLVWFNIKLYSVAGSFPVTPIHLAPFLPRQSASHPHRQNSSKRPLRPRTLLPHSDRSLAVQQQGSARHGKSLESPRLPRMQGCLFTKTHVVSVCRVQWMKRGEGGKPTFENEIEYRTTVPYPIQTYHQHQHRREWGARRFETRSGEA